MTNVSQLASCISHIDCIFVNDEPHASNNFLSIAVVVECALSNAHEASVTPVNLNVRLLISFNLKHFSNKWFIVLPVVPNIPDILTNLLQPLNTYANPVEFI